MGSFETNSHPHNEVKTICGERRKDGYEVSGINVQTIILVFFFSLLLKKDCRKKRIGCEVALCVSTENVKGACYVSEIEDYLLPTYRICSPNAASEVQSYRSCHSWRVDALHIIVYKGMLTTKRIFCYKDSLISDKVLNIEVVKTVFLRKIRDFGIKCLPLHLQTPLASRWYSVHSGTFYKL